MIDLKKLFPGVLVRQKRMFRFVLAVILNTAVNIHRAHMQGCIQSVYFFTQATFCNVVLQAVIISLSIRSLHGFIH